MNDRIYYVYAWFREDYGTPFYIGKGKGKRFEKIKERSPHFTNILNCTDTHVIILQDGLTEQEALKAEMDMIFYLVKVEKYSSDIPDDDTPKNKTHHLVNQTWGGEGTSGFTFKQSEETIAKRVAKTTGQKRTKKQIENLKAGSQKRFRENPQDLEKLKQARIGCKTSDETKEILRQQKLGKSLSEEHKRKIGEGVRMNMTEETREKQKQGTIDAIGVKIKCIELNKTFSSISECQKFFKKNYNMTINRTQLKLCLNGETKKGWYKEIIINGVLTQLHWEKLN